MQFHEKLYTLRKTANMTQSDLAEKLNVSRQAVSRWEMGTAKPEVDTLIAMSDLFGVTLDDLLKNKEDAPAQEKPEPPGSAPSYWHFVPKKWWVFAVIGMGWTLLRYVLLFVTMNEPNWVLKFSDWANASDIKSVLFFISIPAMTIWANVFFILTGLCFFRALVRWINFKRATE